MMKRFRLVSAAELIEQAETRETAIRAGRIGWGPWRYSPKSRTLTTRQPYTYEIDLDTCTDSAHVLNWIAQIAGKGWPNGIEIVGHLVVALNDLLHLQGTMCGLGRNRTLDVRAYLRRRA